jgi:hypothetical protein
MKHHRRNVFCVSVNVALSCDWSEWLERIHAKPSAKPVVPGMTRPGLCSRSPSALSYPNLQDAPLNPYCEDYGSRAMWKAIVVIVSQLEHRAVFGLLHPLPV